MKENELAINGGKPVRKRPLPLEFPGVHHMDVREIQAAVRLLKSRSLFRYYGVKLQNEVKKLESEFAKDVDGALQDLHPGIVPAPVSSF